jgi:hypothetical protein
MALVPGDDMDLHLLELLPLLGLTGQWRGYRVGGKMIGSHKMSRGAKDAFDKARREGDRATVMKIADEQHEKYQQSKGQLPPNPQVAKTIKAEESVIRNNDYETGVLVAPDGSISTIRKGSKDSVTFTHSEIEQMRGQTFTHNHPIGDTNKLGNSFSDKDMHMASMGRLAEVRAVTPSLEYSAKLDLSSRSGLVAGRTIDDRKAAAVELYNRATQSYVQKARKVYQAEGMDSPRTQALYVHTGHLIAREYARLSNGVVSYNVTGKASALRELSQAEQIYDGI